jgi:hypothetical protein
MVVVQERCSSQAEFEGCIVVLGNAQYSRDGGIGKDRPTRRSSVDSLCRSILTMTDRAIVKMGLVYSSGVPDGEKELRLSS